MTPTMLATIIIGFPLGCCVLYVVFGRGSDV